MMAISIFLRVRCSLFIVKFLFKNECKVITRLRRWRKFTSFSIMSLRLNVAEIANQLDDVKELAKTAAAIKDANKRGAIHFAAREGQTEVCKYLLEELGLNVNEIDDDGMFSSYTALNSIDKYLLPSPCSVMIKNLSSAFGIFGMF